MRAAHLLQQLELQRIVHHQLEAMVRRLLQLRGAEHALEQHDGRRDAGGAQRQPLFQARHGEGIGLPQGERGRHQPMPVGVGLDDRHDTGAAGARTDDAEVVAQGVRVDDGPDQPAHRNTPSA